MPPELDDNQNDLQSSEQITDVTETQETAEGVAEPSTAPDEPKDMLSVVRDVVKAETEETASSAAQAEDAAGEAADQEPEKKDDTDYSDVPFNKHPRFQELLKKSKTFEADATRYRNIEGFLKDNHLAADEAADGLQIMALAKTNPAAALEKLKPFVQKLLIAAGEVLPEDLKGQVQNGVMPADAAREVSRARAALAHQQEMAKFEEQRRQEEAAQMHARSLADTAQSWVTDRLVKDPAFDSKRPLLQREIAYLQRMEGRPDTPEGVRDQLNRAYAEVNKQARVVAPATPRPAVRPVTGGAAPGTPTAQPKTMLEAMRASLGQ